MSGQAIYIFCGFWALAMLAIFIQAIRLSYRIEGRSPDLTNKSAVPRNAMIFHTVLNLNVARDSDTQALRRRMNLLLLACLASFVLMLAVIVGAGAAD